MVVMLGKRKRSSPRNEEVVPAVSSPEDSDTDVRARFQKAFEARFKPLKAEPVTTVSTDLHDSDDQSDDSIASDDGESFDGCSDSEAAVEVIEHGAADHSTDYVAQRREMKAFMSSRPPSATATKPGKQSAAKKDESKDDEGESTNLKHDLALQRLLKESHLLDPASSGGALPSSLAPEGKARLKALDLRLQDLGAKTALGADARMPMSHRKGIVAKAHGKEVKRRKEAAENGIILERPAPKSSSASKLGPNRRERSVGGPSMGKFRGGMLKLSSKDVRSITGGGKSATRGGGKRRGR